MFRIAVNFHTIVIHSGTVKLDNYVLGYRCVQRFNVL
jgi:hypothetical protein